MISYVVARLRDVLGAWRAPFDFADTDIPDDYLGGADEFEWMECPDTQPTAPGALDDLPERKNDD